MDAQKLVKDGWRVEVEITNPKVQPLLPSLFFVASIVAIDCHLLLQPLLLLIVTWFYWCYCCCLPSPSLSNTMIVKLFVATMLLKLNKRSHNCPSVPVNNNSNVGSSHCWGSIHPSSYSHGISGTISNNNSKIRSSQHQGFACSFSYRGGISGTIVSRDISTRELVVCHNGSIDIGSGSSDRGSNDAKLSFWQRATPLGCKDFLWREYFCVVGGGW